LTQGYLGTPGGKRVLHRVHPLPISKTSRDAITGGRDKRYIEQRGNRSPTSFISQLFLVKKKGGGFKPLVNLKGLNQYIGTEHFDMEELHLLPSLAQQGTGW